MLRSFRWLPVLLALIAARPAAAETSLIAGRQPSRSEGVLRARLLTDGVRARDADFWNTDLTAVFRSAAAFVEYDLGAPHAIAAAYLHGDNNDRYVVSGSLDGASFAPLWDAGPVERPGLQGRSSAELRGTARFVRITAAGGDGLFALSEVQLFATRPAALPDGLRERRGADAGLPVRNALLLFALGVAALLLVARRGAPAWWYALAALPAAFTGYRVIAAFAEAWPPAPREVSMVRAVLAALALLALGREHVLRRFAVHPRVVLGVLGLTAAGGMAAFFNLGHFFNWDHKAARPGFVHAFDMRVYFPVAKYFRELRFDGLYAASVAAYVDDDPSTSLDKLARTELRDLVDHRMTTVAESRAHIAAVKARFAPPRWEEFRRDLRYFRETMGVGDYLGSMTDHGGNATPLWLALAHLLFRGADAGDGVLTATALIDPALLLLLFAVVWRTFGARAALLSATVFGVTDLPVTTNTTWAGATLRHDWLVCLGLGVCLLRRERWRLGGALLALAAMIRAFPAVALVGLALPALWSVAERVRAERRLPRLRALAAEHRPVVEAAIGAAICVAASLLVSSVLFGPTAWLEWLHKVASMDADAHVNDVSLRVLVGGSDEFYGRTLRNRTLVYFAAIAASIAVVAVAARRQRPERAALCALALIPVLFNPSNYYLHFVFLLPLLGDDTPAVDHVAVSGPLLAMSVAQYWTVLDPSEERHFQAATAMLFVALLAILLRVTRRAERPPTG